MPLPRVVLPQVDRDPAHGDGMTCWVCRQRWPHAFDMILDQHNRELRIDGASPIRISPAEGNMLAVLINAFPRWMTRTQIAEHAWAELPDRDMPNASGISSHIKRVRDVLHGTRYTVQTDLSKGFRLVDEQTLEAERKYAEAQMPKVRIGVNMALMSRGAMKKTRTYVAPKPKKVRKPRNKKERIEAKARALADTPRKDAFSVIRQKRKLENV